MFYILICGKAGSGKTTLAHYITNQAAYSSIASFAGKLKETAAQLGWDGKKDARGRRFLQQLGWAARNYDPDVWVRATVEGVEEGQLVVVDDWRFPNEKYYFTHNGIPHTIIKIAGRKSRLPGDLAEDVSETALDYWPDDVFDYVVDNSGSLMDLSKIGKQIAAEHGYEPTRR